MDYVIEANRLSKSYGDKRAICDITFGVARGEVVGLVGANGAGKTTTVETILGLKNPDRGSATILGQNPKERRKKLFQKVGVQLQEGSYQDKITVGELCKMTRALYKHALDFSPLLEQFGLADKPKSMVADLSGGQRQRLFIVLALIPDPDVLFLDELTTGLDTRARRDVWKCLNELKNKTILLTSHFMDEIEVLCDRIVILKDGHIIFCGSVDEAIARSPYDRLEEAYLWFTEGGESL